LRAHKVTEQLGVYPENAVSTGNILRKKGKSPRRHTPTKKPLVQQCEQGATGGEYQALRRNAAIANRPDAIAADEKFSATTELIAACVPLARVSGTFVPKMVW
jgi:hypothetical protein